MALNVRNGNMYSFVTHTWNSAKGICPHGCSYCYMKKPDQNPIWFDEYEFYTDLKKDNFIFVGSSNDLFAESIRSYWIEQTLKYCSMFDNKYLFQSKNPKRFAEFELPQKSLVCTTIETNRWYPEIMNNTPQPEERANAMELASQRYPAYVTIEPIMEFDLEEMVGLIRKCNPIQVNIGADSKGHNLPEPSREKIFALINELQKFISIDKKRNLGRLLG